MHTCPVCATKCVLLLFLSLCRCSLAQLLIDSTDMGVHKCEFQGRLGDETVQLYVFLTACVRPFSDGGAPPGAMKSTIKTTTTTATKAADGNAPAVSPSVQGAPAGAHGTRVLAAAEAAPPSPPLQPPPLPNFFLSGFAFMFVPKQPVHTTQLQQPLSTILWAAQRPRGDYHLPQPPVGRAGASSSSSSNNNVGSSSSSSSNASGSTNAAPNGNRSSSSSSSSSSSTGGSSSGGGDVGAGGVTSSRSDATNNDIPRVAGVRRPRGLMQEDVTAPWPPDTYLGAVYEAAVQLVNGTYGAISIRSLHSSQQHAVHLSFRDPLHWIVNPHLRRVPGRLSLRAVLSPDDLAAITNVTTGTATESAAVQPGSPAFEIRATGFDGTCSYTPSPSRGRTLLPAANIPTCGWLDPDRVAYDNSIYKIWRSIQQQNGPSRLHRTRRKHQRRKQKRRQSPPPPPPPPPATSFSPPKYMVLSPYFNLAPYDFATLLIHHLDYHATLGGAS
ncbi:hypothetical protein Vafri_16636 [Volvox africanus]|uniref:Uncharacterized protein n=1 Tax=Volvox africanus TaxID=51714 RepID=A0A8J4F608_9CHLO|nr:hypothetical protein Vafri_16636 [Volvox africanus]